MADTPQYDFYSIDQRFLTREVLESLPKGQKIMIWTVNTSSQYKKVLSMIDGLEDNLSITLITDYPDILCEYVAQSDLPKENKRMQYIN